MPRPIPEVQTIAIIGAGLMGWQIGLLCARAGYTVRLMDRDPAALERARQRQQATLEQWAAQGRLGRLGPLTEPPAVILRRLTYTTDLAQAVAGAQFVIEAVTEKLEVKRQVFAELDRLCPPTVVLATNSSSIRSALLAPVTRHPERVLNFHFLNHPWERPYVETMTCGQTRPEYLDLAQRLGRSLGIASVLVRGEVQGFIHNRIWRAIKKEAMYLVDQGHATVEDVDRAVMIGLGAPRGPFQMMDRAGLDVMLDIERQWYAETGDERDRPPRILEEKVARGELGLKTGRGFYPYPDPPFERPGWLLDQEETDP